LNCSLSAFTNKMLSIAFWGIFFFSSSANAQSCDTFTNEVDCATSDGCSWIASSDLCRCDSEVNFDILFNIDTSGSINNDEFNIEREFILKLVTMGINSERSRLGFFLFAKEVNESRGLQLWGSGELESYVNALANTKGATNTRGVLNASIAEFKNSYEAERQHILIMLTDGNPNDPDQEGNYDVCEFAHQFKENGIRVIIIAVGDGISRHYVDCLCRDEDDFIPVDQFTIDDFDSIMGTLSDIVCPVAKEAVITEVKAERKGDGWNRRWSRFVEVYNAGVAFNVNDIELNGLVAMAHGDGPNVTVSQGQYLVFYDAADDEEAVGGESTVSCHQCGASCSLDECAVAGDTTSGEHCWCENAVYVGCRNTAEQCPRSLSTGNSNAANDGCSVCTFNDNMHRSSWNISLSDSASSIDEVSYDSSTWPTTGDGSSYELKSKGFDNGVGDNWAPSCSVLGTPGSDPMASCDAECVPGDSCGGGGRCDPQSLICDCDDGYYPQCTSSTSCTACLAVPAVRDCNVSWTKNGTDRLASFEWTAADRDGDTRYKLTYFAGSKHGGASDVTTYAVVYQTADYWNGNASFGGFVESTIDVCTDTAGSSICTAYHSARTACAVTTRSPTTSPTPAPTPWPTVYPTNEPTPSPLWQCPTFWWSNDEVCDSERCRCSGDEPDSCCLDDPDFETTYDAERGHSSGFECRLDSDLVSARQRELGEDAAGHSEGYLLGMREHHFLVGIGPDGYPHPMDIHWALQLDTVCFLENDEETTCVSDDVAVAGLRVDPMEGHLTVWGGDDALNASVSFTVSRLSCEAAEEVIDNATSNGTVFGGPSCFDNTAVYGHLVIVNATSRAQPDCYDGRIYPMRIPVWFRYAEAIAIPPADTEELPGWIWWLFAALLGFAGALALLLRWNMYRSQRNAEALSAKRREIDAEVEVYENGWQSGMDPDAVNFNPLATGTIGFPIEPESPLKAGDGKHLFVRPNVEKLVFREQYGPSAGTGNLSV